MESADPPRLSWYQDDVALLSLPSGRVFVVGRREGVAIEALIAHPNHTADQVVAELERNSSITADADQISALMAVLRSERSGEQASDHTYRRVMTFSGVTWNAVRRKVGLVILCVLAGCGTVAILLRAPAGGYVSLLAWSPVSWFVLAAAVLVTRYAHEAGHCLAGLRVAQRAEVRSRRYFVWPVLSSKINGLEHLERRERIRVTVAGLAAHVLAAVALMNLLWLNLGLVSRGVTWELLETLFIALPMNLSPSATGNSDGYYILVDVFGQPNLRLLSAEFLGDCVRARLRPNDLANAARRGVLTFLAMSLLFSVVIPAAFVWALTRGTVRVLLVCMIVLVRFIAIERSLAKRLRKGEQGSSLII